MTDSLYIVALDGTDNSGRALDFACGLAKETGAKLLLTHVINWSGFQPVSAMEVAARPIDKGAEEKYTREKILGPAKKAAEAKGVEAETWFNWGNPARAINEQAEKKGASMIVMGRSGHGSIAELVLGSVSNALAHHSKIPVVLVP